LQAEHLSLLVGNGLTTAAAVLAGGRGISMERELTLDGGIGEKIEQEALAEAERMRRGPQT